MRRKPQKLFQSRKPPTVTKCDPGCLCKDTGMIMVINEGQFRTAGGNKLSDQLVPVLCLGSKGERIRLKSHGVRLPSYNPETMRLPGQSKQKTLFDGDQK